ncbi:MULTISPECIES: LysR family transcriptional regulator [unclassified Bradyrhizobium]|uniref:LysR family transcriptional regulator n=1 Tax=Bradyrhizobium TaxID=374 RepID=UPI001CD43FF3|nr:MULTISPECIES: LysR family transcriptional regulator [unclassified Bradyrhizobium]MCA1374477.1 LysR family transcriptional regulator [Bradyrhizobium sp. IC4060]MCA1389653.1 LysR family transcriptional regulator [Bradyrhizobium sp. IC3123]MCA1473078.1 LysR family transcriptional regulator [Bradyrhizobium sp. IC3195]MCA1488469.1 LysR family transcriptional regulator [Bradyrhizobium sp. IC4061]MCA1495643.1 LysR family transcriptional regulator [Bradyrhizobium sp. NBAIM14]
MDRLDELATFVAIVEVGSLVGAAKRLKRSPPAVTRALAALEERVGRRLVERTTRRLAPTDAGRHFAERARELVNGYSTVMSRLVETEGAPLHGILRIAAPTIFGRRHVAPIVSSFLDAHPAIRIELVMGERSLDLISEGIDVAVRIGQPRDSRLVVRSVGSVRRVLVASPSYLRRQPELRHPRDIPKHDVVFFSGFAGPTELRFQNRGRLHTVRMMPRLMTTDLDTVIAAVTSGQGIARLLSYQVEAEISSGKLVRLLPAYEPPAVPVQVVIPGSRRTAPAVRAFADHAAASLRTLSIIRH